MGRYLVKTEKNKDLYLLWSTVTDSPISVGTKADLEAILLLDAIVEAKGDIAALFHRADITDSEGEIYQSEGWLPPRNFTPLAERLLKAPPDADLTEIDVSDLLEPLEE